MKQFLLVVMIALIAGGAYWLLRSTSHRAVATGPDGSSANESSAIWPVGAVELQGDGGENSTRADVESPENAPVAGDLRSQIQVAAMVQNEDGQPVEGATLTARSGASQTRAFADASGYVECALTADETGTVRVLVEADGYAVHVAKARTQRGRMCHLGIIRLHTGASLVGRVIDDQGVPSVGTALYVEVDVDPRAAQPVAGRPFPHASNSARQLGSHFESELPPEVQRGKTGAAGRYVLSGLAAGWVRVWAVAAGSLTAYTDPIEVEGGSRLEVGDLVVERLAAESTIAGRLLGPDGTALRGARITPADVVWYDWTGARSGEQGGFELAVVAGEVYDLVVDDPLSRGCPVIVGGVAAGTRNLEPRLQPCEQLSLVVIDEARRQIPEFGYDVYDEEREFPPRHHGVEYRGDRATSLAIPPGRFTIDVWAPGHASATMGPFDPQDLPKEIEVILVSRVNLRGRVTSFGHPVPGASIEIRPRVNARTGFALDLHCITPPELPATTGPAAYHTSTDADGGFGLQVVEANPSVLRVEAAGYAPALVADIQAGPDVILIELTPGGGIDGSAVDENGVPRPGLLLAATSGDGHVALARTDGSGLFALDHLAPGPHWLAILASEPPSLAPPVRVSTLPSANENADTNFFCTIVEGVRTPVSLVARSFTPRRWEGRVRIEGVEDSEWSTAGWEAYFYSAASSPEKGKHSSIDQSGLFGFQLESPGEYRLLLSGRLPSGSSIHVMDRLRVDSELGTWNETISLGSLEVLLTRPAMWSPSERITCSTDLRDGLRAIVDVDHLSAKGGGPNSVVAGPARILREPRFRKYPTEGELDILATCRIDAGALTTVSIP